MKLPDFEYVAPASADQVVKLLASRLGEAKVIAGGQSLLVDRRIFSPRFTLNPSVYGFTLWQPPPPRPG